MIPGRVGPPPLPRAPADAVSSRVPARGPDFFGYQPVFFSVKYLGTVL